MDLGQQHLYMVQLDFRTEGPLLRTATAVPYPEEQAELLESGRRLRDLVRQARTGQRFAGTRAVVCLPPDEVKLGLVQYRVGADSQEASIVLRQAMERVDGVPEDWIVDYVPVQAPAEGDGERTALVACARREKVIGYLDRLHDAGLEVAAVEVGPVALRRVVNALAEIRDESNVLTINFGRDRTFFTVYSNRRLSLDREVAFGENELTGRVAETLDMSVGEVRELLYRYGLSDAAPCGPANHAGDDPQAVSNTLAAIVKPRLLELADEVEKAVIYTAAQLRGAGIDCVYLLGGMARWPGAGPFLAHLLALPVRVLNPFEALAVDNGGASRDPSDPVAGYAIATGCALRDDRADG